MVKNLVNSIEKLVFEKSTKKFGVSRILKENDDKPVFIKDVNGYPVIGNLCTRDVIAESLGIEKEDLMKHMVESMSNEKNGELIVDEGLEKLYIDDDLKKIHDYPIPTYYGKDAGPYLTSGVVIVKDKDEGVNASIHRILVRPDGNLAIRMVEQRHLHYIYNKNIGNGEVDCAIVIGVHPAVLLAASTSGDVSFNELKYASALMNKPLNLVKCKTVDLEVPEAEFIIEAKITAEMVDEGPFVDITGTYDVIRKQPLINVTALRRKEDAIFHALLPGGSEHKLLMGIPQEPRMYKGIRNTVPSLKNVALTQGGCCWLNAVVSIDKKTEGDGKNAILAALAAHPSLKHVTVVDDDINIYDANDVEYAVATRVQSDKDIIIIPGAKGSSLDPSADHKNKLTAKMGIDATMSLLKGKEEFIRAEVPKDDE
ncbi:putative carboxy-lyase [Methanococcus maripaludis KA1]|uniref:Anhydromevalonate phosphate decarboxylase n=1 Tax=Methanococcus maripaludis KA1 TaxID=637914 RepID=A0A2Z5PF45_METMI|nr:UbiD family decarboxylase [Methanococcus maripaludis]BAP61630.1 putative carboxy-lyase [Methanococcus maripaludis KA1]